MQRQRHIANVLADTQRGANNRKAGRLVCELVKCDLGEVLDLSRSGMRVKAKGTPGVKKGECYALTINGPGVRLTLGTKVVWVKKSGLLGGVELGLEFTTIPEEAKTAFSALVRAIVA